jgi:membrane dipeptidase
MTLTRRAALASAASVLVAETAARAAKHPAVPAWRKLHDSLVTLDTHLDAPMNFARPGWDIMERHSYATDLSQVDYPRMVEGGLKGGFWAIYTPQGPLTDEGYRDARDAALLRATEIHEMVARNYKHFEMATVPDDAARIAASGKRIVYMSIENSWPLGTDVTLLQSFHKLGVRLAGPVHFQNNQFGDSATDPKGKTWNGFSPLGKDWLKEANDLGIVLDASHSSDDIFDQMIELSRAPIMCSHSGCKAIHDHPRNLDDARIKKLAAANGTIQINSFSSYLVTTPENPDYENAAGAAFMKLRGASSMSPKDARAAVAEAAGELIALRKKFAVPRATFDDVMQHMHHALDLVGPEHVGVGLDWDGGGGVSGMEDCASDGKITEALVKSGATESDLRAIWGGNALRVLGAAEAAAKPAAPPPAPNGGGE